MILDGHNPDHVRAAAQRLVHGQLVGFPTETVYGLGARADDDNAVRLIFEAKGRPADHPLIVHVAQPSEAESFAAVFPEVARRLTRAFWPGPVTIIVPRTSNRAKAAAGGQDTVALRCPAHPVAAQFLQFAREDGVLGVAAPSANRFGGVSPTSAQHVADEFGPDLLILDGGHCEVGIESTIIDCSREVPALLRPGVLTRAKIEAAAGQPISGPGPGITSGAGHPRRTLRAAGGGAPTGQSGPRRGHGPRDTRPNGAVYAQYGRRSPRRGRPAWLPVPFDARGSPSGGA